MKRNTIFTSAVNIIFLHVSVGVLIKRQSIISETHNNLLFITTNRNLEFEFTALTHNAPLIKPAHTLLQVPYVHGLYRRVGPSAFPAARRTSLTQRGH